MRQGSLEVEAEKLMSTLELPQNFIQIKHNDGIFSRLLTREISMSNSSLEVYHGEASAAIPFLWESQPGTSKFKCPETSLPPLTPPPCYLVNAMRKPTKKKSMPKLLHLIFSKLTLRKTQCSPPSPASSSSLSSPSSSSWTSSSSSTPSSPIIPPKTHGSVGLSSPRLSSIFDSR